MVLPLLGLAVGGVAIAGLGLAVVSTVNPDETIGDKLQTTLIRVGYVSEGVLKGSGCRLADRTIVQPHFCKIGLVGEWITRSSWRGNVFQFATLHPFPSAPQWPGGAGNLHWETTSLHGCGV